MIAFYLSLVSVMLYYSKSKYFPRPYQSYFRLIPSWLGLLGFIGVGFFYCYQWGAVNGILISVVVIPLACCLVSLAFHLPKRIGVILGLVIHLFLFLTLYINAS